jgi:hypothetical protein
VSHVDDSEFEGACPVCLVAHPEIKPGQITLGRVAVTSEPYLIFMNIGVG